MGDAYGAPYEGGIVERLLWKMIGKTSTGRLRYTDDTQMSIDLANSFLTCHSIDQAHLAQTFAQSYRWSRGYGPSVAKLLKKIRRGADWQAVNRLKYKEGSMGNGAAMRAPILALCYPHQDSDLQQSVIKASEITHAHPLAIEGAQLIAFVTAAVLNDHPTQHLIECLPDQCQSKAYQVKMTHCLNFLQMSESINKHTLIKTLGNGILATESCVSAIYWGLKYRDRLFTELMDQVIKTGGDVDTIAAMAGAIWGAANGSDELKPIAHYVEDSERIIEMAGQLHAKRFVKE